MVTTETTETTETIETIETIEAVSPDSDREVAQVASDHETKEVRNRAVAVVVVVSDAVHHVMEMMMVQEVRPDPDARLMATEDHVLNKITMQFNYDDFNFSNKKKDLNLK